MSPAPMSPVFLVVCILLYTTPVFTQQGPPKSEFENLVDPVVKLPADEQQKREFEGRQAEVEANNYIDATTQMPESTEGPKSPGTGETSLKPPGTGETSPKPPGPEEPETHGTGETSPKPPVTDKPEPTGTDGPKTNGNGTESASLKPPPDLWNAKKIIGVSTCAICLLSIILLLFWDKCCRRSE